MRSSKAFTLQDSFTDASRSTLKWVGKDFFTGSGMLDVEGTQVRDETVGREKTGIQGVLKSWESSESVSMVKIEALGKRDFFRDRERRG